MERNPRLVYGRMTGFGQDGPLALRAGHDINYIAISGALWPLGRAGDAPVPPLNLVGDFGGGALFLALGVLAGVISARVTREGQVVDASMVDGSALLMTMTHALLNAGMWREERGVNFLDTGAHFYEVYQTSDLKFVAVGAIEEKFYAELLHGLGLAGVGLPDQMDQSQWPVMKERFASIFLSKTRDQWTEIFGDVDACVTPVLSPTEAVHHRYNVQRDVFARGPVAQPNPAPRFSRTPGEIREQPLAPGSEATPGLGDWGVPEARIAQLREAGAIA